MPTWTRQEPKPLDHYRKYSRAYGMDMDTIKQLLLLANFGSDDSRKHALHTLEQIDMMIKMSEFDTPKPFLAIPEGQRQTGDFVLADYFQGSQTAGKCWVKVSDLPSTIDVSNIGTGKTRAMIHIIRSAVKASKKKGGKLSFFCIDRRDDFRSLGIDEVVLRLGTQSCGINIWENPLGTDPVTWTAHMAESFVNSINAWLASRNQLMLAIEATKNMTSLMQAAADLLRRKSSASAPTFAEVYQTIMEDYYYDKRKSFRQVEVEEVLIDRCFSMLIQAKDSFTARRSVPIEEMLDNGVSIVLEADVSPDLYSLLLSWATLRMMHVHKSKGVRGTISLERGTGIAADEGRWIWQPEKEHSEQRQYMGASWLDMMPLYVRDFSLAIVTAAQRRMSADVMASARILMAGRLPDFRDARGMALSMGDESLVKVFSKLDVAERVVKVGDSEPALIRFPEVEFHRISDEELETKMRPMWDHLAKWCFPEQQTLQEKRKPQVRLSDRQMAILDDINKHPDRTHTYRLLDVLGSSNASAQRVIKDLEEIGYIKAVAFRVGRTVKKFHVPLQPAIDWMRSKGMNVSHIALEGNVSPHHRLVCILIISALRKRGYNVFHDHQVGKKRVDVYCEGVCYEVAVHEKMIVDNVLDALSNGAERFVFACYDDTVQSRIFQSLQKDPRIEVRLASMLVDKLQTPTLVSIMDKQDKQDNQLNGENRHAGAQDIPKAPDRDQGEDAA